MLQNALNVYVRSFSGLSRDIWLLSVVMLINRAGTMVIPFMTVYLTQSLDYSLPQAGLVMTCFGAGSVLGAYLGGRFSDRFGYFSVQVSALIGSGLLFIVLSFFKGLAALCILIFLISTVADAFRPANFVAVAAYSRPENRTRALALIRLAVNLGFALGPAIGGIVAASMGYSLLFWLDGLTCIFAGLFLVFSLRPKAGERQAEQEVEKRKPANVLRDRRYLFFLFLVFANALVFMQLFNSLPVFLKQDYGLNEAQIGRLMALNGLMIAIVEMPLVYILERRFNLYRVVGLGTLLTGFSFLIYNFFPPMVLIAWTSMIIITVGEILSLPFIASMAIEHSDEQSRGRYMAYFSMSWSISQIIAPTMGLQIAGAWGFNALWAILMIFCLIATLGFLYFGLRIKENTPSPVSKASI